MGDKRLEAEAFTRTLTGFEEIAIRKMFRDSLGTMDQMMIPRALLFVEAKREGANDADAFRKVMEMQLGDVEQHFTDPEESAGDDEGKAPRSGSGPTS